MKFRLFLKQTRCNKWRATGRPSTELGRQALHQLDLIRLPLSLFSSRWLMEIEKFSRFSYQCGQNGTRSTHIERSYGVLYGIRYQDIQVSEEGHLQERKKGGKKEFFVYFHPWLTFLSCLFQFTIHSLHISTYTFCHLLVVVCIVFWYFHKIDSLLQDPKNPKNPHHLHIERQKESKCKQSSSSVECEWVLDLFLFLFGRS